MTTLLLSDLGTTLRSLRQAAGYTQAQVASRARVARSRLIAIESGQRPNLELATLLKLLELYGQELQVVPAAPRRSLNQVLRESRAVPRG